MTTDNKQILIHHSPLEHSSSSGYKILGFLWSGKKSFQKSYFLQQRKWFPPFSDSCQLGGMVLQLTQAFAALVTWPILLSKQPKIGYIANPHVQTTKNWLHCQSSCPTNQTLVTLDRSTACAKPLPIVQTTKSKTNPPIRVLWGLSLRIGANANGSHWAREAPNAA